MAEQEISPEEGCPRCGQPLNRWPTLEPDGFLLVCDECGYERAEAPLTSSGQQTPSQTSASGHEKLQQLLDQEQPAEWSEELLAQLPPEAQAELKAKGKSGASKLPSAMEQRLRGYGYVLAEDAQGARLIGEGPKPGTGDLSPMDVVRLAAELEGGLPTEGERKSCPHCQAALPPNAQQCQWCGQSLPESPKKNQE